MKTILWLVIIPALLPVVILFWYIYAKDKVEKEPFGFVCKILFMGAIFGPIAIPLEKLAASILSNIFIDSLSFDIAQNFLGIALVEESIKLAVFMIFVWKNKNFNYKYDAIVYAATSSLGFAALENLLYIISFGTQVAFVRAIFSIPGHGTFGIFMGYFLGKAKYHQNRENTIRYWINMFLAISVPTIVHGTYDFLLSESAIEISINSLFYVLVIVIDLIALKIIKRISKKDQLILTTEQSIEHTIETGEVLESKINRNKPEPDNNQEKDSPAAHDLWPFN